MRKQNLLTKLILVSLGIGVFSNTPAAAPLSGSDPVIIKATQIRGAEGTGSCGGGYGLGVGLVDLDHGLGAGATTYDHGGFLWCETYAPYLWSEQDGTSTLQLDEKHLYPERDDPEWEQGRRWRNLL